MKDITVESVPRKENLEIAFENTLKCLFFLNEYTKMVTCNDNCQRSKNDRRTENRSLEIDVSENGA